MSADPHRVGNQAKRPRSTGALASMPSSLHERSALVELLNHQYSLWALMRGKRRSTFSPLEHIKTAKEWFANLPKHAEPDAETLRKRKEARENRKFGLQGHRRRGAEAEALNRKARPLWRELMGGDEKAA